MKFFIKIDKSDSIVFVGLGLKNVFKNGESDFNKAGSYCFGLGYNTARHGRYTNGKYEKDDEGKTVDKNSEI